MVALGVVRLGLAMLMRWGELHLEEASLATLQNG